jgi:hypothetical protein
VTVAESFGTQVWSVKIDEVSITVKHSPVVESDAGS